MATTKKPTAKQLAARAKFAALAKSGALARMRGKKKSSPRKKPVRSKKQDIAIAMQMQREGRPRKAKEFFERAARAKNPSRSISHHRVASPSRYAVHLATSDGKPGALIASFVHKNFAVEYGRALATHKKHPVIVVGKK